MLIDDNELPSFIEGSLRAIQDASIQLHTRPCPHCGIPVRYPIIARKQDVEDFRALIQSACRVMDKYGITLNLLAEIEAECHIEIARRRAIKGEPS